MAKTRGSKEGVPRDSSLSMPSEQKTSESNKQKISRIYDIFPGLTKDNIAKILQYYDDDLSQALDALTRDGGREALSNWTESGSLKNKNNKNKKKKKKAKKDGASGMSATASFDADDSSSLHSGGNLDADVEKDSQRLENENSILNDDDTVKLSHERLENEVESVSNEPVTESEPTLSVCASSAPEESLPTLECDSEQTKIPSPDDSEKPDEPISKKDKFRSVDNNYQKYPPRQRTNSFRRSKSSSMSEDQSSQHNSQSAAAPTKRGYEKCKKDLNRQTISLQRIFSQVDKGFDESAKKIKSVFAEIKNNLEERQKALEAELEKNKIDATNLIKGRQDLAVDLKRRVDRSNLSEAEWSDLRSDIKQFVTERKYDDDLGKTIWFHWTDIVEVIKIFGEVTPVKNVYSQRSQSAVGNSGSNNSEPSPSSSLANDEVESSADKNDVANISDAVEIPSVGKEGAPAYNKTHSSENRTTRVYSNTKYNQGRFPGGNNYHGQAFHRNQRGGFSRNNYSYRQNNYEGNFRNHPRHDRDGRMNEGPYINDRNMNNPKDYKFRNQSQGNNRHYNYNNNRYRNNNMGGHRHQEKHPEEHNHPTPGITTELVAIDGFAD